MRCAVAHVRHRASVYRCRIAGTPSIRSKGAVPNHFFVGMNFPELFTTEDHVRELAKRGLAAARDGRLKIVQALNAKCGPNAALLLDVLLGTLISYRF